MATAHYRDQYSDCPLCSCDAFEAGFIDDRLKEAHWPKRAKDPDFASMERELDERFGLSVTEDEIQEHWELHVKLSLDGYQEWARDKTEHSPAKDPYGAGMMVDDGGDGEDEC